MMLFRCRLNRRLYQRLEEGRAFGGGEPAYNAYAIFIDFAALVPAVVSRQIVFEIDLIPSTKAAFPL